MFLKKSLLPLLAKMKGTPDFDWKLTGDINFLDWSTDFLHLPSSSHLTSLRHLFITLSADMEALGQAVQDPEDDEDEQGRIQALEGALVKNHVPVCVLLYIIF